MEFCRSQPNYRNNYCGVAGAIRHKLARTIYRLRTFSFDSLRWLHDLFYNADGVKVIRPELDVPKGAAYEF
jgi:hypothetical protein